MSELYKEAIVEAKKLKEIAEIDARNKIIEAVTPYIKKIIASEAAGGTDTFLFGTVKEEEQPMDDPMMGDVVPPPVEEPAVTPGDLPNAAPISPSDGLVGMPMPDDEGKITVDFQQLFSMGGGDALATPPAAGDLSDVSQSEILPPSPSVPGSEPGAVGGEPPPVAPVAPVGALAPVGGAVPGAEIPGAPPGAAAAAPAPGGVPPLPGEEIPPEEQPVPPITGESKIMKFQGDVRLVAEKIDYLYFRGSVPLLVKESLKSKLFTLCEKLDEMVNEDVISSKKARLAENKLEFLFMKLNEAEQRNSYKEIKGVSMTTLREFAAKLFEEDALGPATADKATAHAEKVSGVQPGVDLFKEGDAPTTDEVTPKDEEEGDLQEMAEALLGEDAPASSLFGDGKMEGDAEGKSPAVHNTDALAAKKGAGIVEGAPSSTAFGDGVKAKGAEGASPMVHKGAALADEKGANTILEFDEGELREAVAKLRKENLARKIAGVKKEALQKGLSGADKDGHLKTPKVPEGDQGKAKPVGGKTPAQKDLKECDMPAAGGGMPMEDSLPPGLGDGDADDMGAEGGAGDEVELTFQIDVDDLEALLNGATEDFVAEPAGEVAVAGDEDSDGIELVDDADADDKGDGEQLLMDTGPEDEGMGYESRNPAVREGKAPARKPALNEAAVVAKAAAAVKSLKTQLSESKLLTAKALYVSKFAVREDLTTKQKQKIAEYFDKAKTLAEAKETYTKIKKILTESASSNKLSGSASRPTSTGSARLTESTQAGGDLIETKRWQLLAGIKAKK